MRRSRSRWTALTAIAVVSVAAGCGGGGGAPSGRSTASGTPATPPPTAVSVRPHHLHATSPIVVSYSGPLTAATPLPAVHPGVPGNWARSGSTAVFTPSQAYPPDSRLTVTAAKRPGGKRHRLATRSTPHGSLRRAEQILARLHYLPLKTSAAAPTTPAAEAAAVYHPPAGTFHWRFGDVPTALRADWTPGRAGQVLRGAVIAFQHDTGLAADGAIGRDTWQSLLAADLADRVDPHPYSYVSADLYLPQRLSVWVDGHTVLTSPVNGGVPSAPTPLGTYPVYERFTATTMSGTNPDGSHYHDPGVPWVNYFSGGSAVHGFPRASYGSPQSVGCLELPVPTAQRVYHLIGYGTLVTVAGPSQPPPTSASPAPPHPSPTRSSRHHGGHGH